MVRKLAGVPSLLTNRDRRQIAPGAVCARATVAHPASVASTAFKLEFLCRRAGSVQPQAIQLFHEALFHFFKAFVYGGQDSDVLRGEAFLNPFVLGSEALLNLVVLLGK